VALLGLGTGVAGTAEDTAGDGTAARPPAVGSAALLWAQAAASSTVVRATAPGPGVRMRGSVGGCL